MIDCQDVVRIYATSLYEISLEKTSEKKFKKISKKETLEQETLEHALFSQICFLEEIFKENFLFVKILMAINIDKNERKNLLDQCLKKSINLYLVNFLKILIDNNRIDLIFKIIQKYKKVYYKNNGIQEVLVISATDLSEKEKQVIITKLEKMLNKKLVVEYLVDEKIIGGLIIRTEDKLFDVSLKNKLEEIKKSIKNNLIISNLSVGTAGENIEK